MGSKDVTRDELYEYIVRHVEPVNGYLRISVPDLMQMIDDYANSKILGMTEEDV